MAAADEAAACGTVGAGAAAGARAGVVIATAGIGGGVPGAGAIGRGSGEAIVAAVADTRGSGAATVADRPGEPAAGATSGPPTFAGDDSASVLRAPGTGNPRKSGGGVSVVSSCAAAEAGPPSAESSVRVASTKKSMALVVISANGLTVGAGIEPGFGVCGVTSTGAGVWATGPGVRLWGPGVLVEGPGVGNSAGRPYRVRVKLPGLAPVASSRFRRSSCWWTAWLGSSSLRTRNSTPALPITPVPSR